jgi:hypothetical protein
MHCNPPLAVRGLKKYKTFSPPSLGRRRKMKRFYGLALVFAILAFLYRTLLLSHSEMDV